MPLEKKTKVFIVDDEEDICLSIKANLESMGNYEVSISNDGEAGLKAIRSQRPDVILLDILMPGMNGMEVLRKLKENLATLSIPVLMLTAVTDQESMRQAAGLYGDAYLLKPIHVQDLKAKIEKVLSQTGKKSV